VIIRNPLLKQASASYVLKKQSDAHAHSAVQAAQQQRKIVVVPVAVAKSGFLLAGILTLCLLAIRLTVSLLIVDFARDSNLFLALMATFTCCFSAPMSVYFRKLAQHRRELNNQMRSFTFSEARSCCEEDCPLLHHIISATYRSGDPADSGDNDGIARFEQHVRSRMPKVVNSLLRLPSVLPTKLIALLGSTIWIVNLDTVAARATLPAELFGGARGKTLFLAADAMVGFATSYGVAPLAATASFALSGIRLGPKCAAYGPELVVFALSVLLPTVVLLGGAAVTRTLFLRLPYALSIPVNMLVLGVARVLTTVRSPPCAGLFGAGRCRMAFAARVGPPPPPPAHLSVDVL
jgi:hypothetical protein